MSHIKTTLAAAIALAIGGPALAQQSSQDRSLQSQSEHGEYRSFPQSDSGRQAEERMGRMDRNRDRRIDQSEAESDPQLIAAWADVDVTQDGAIDATEYYLYAATTRIAELESGQQGDQSRQSREGQQSGQSQFGQSRDDRQSRESQQSRDGQQFGQDRSRDSQQSQDSRQFGQSGQSDERDERRSREERQGRSGDAGGQFSGERSQSGQSQDGRTGQNRSGDAGMPSFDELDEDSGGYVTRDEFEEAVADAEFGRADANRDGWLSRSEYQAAYSGAGENRAQRGQN